MKRLIAVALATAPLLLWAAPAQASEPAPKPCVAGEVSAWHPSDGVVMARTKPNTPLECTAYLSTYQLPDSWDGNGWNATASPQTLLASTQITIGRQAQAFQAALPECGGAQVDLTPAAVPERITYPSGIGQPILDGHHFTVDGDCESPSPTPTTESPSPTPTTESPSPTPTKDKPTPSETEGPPANPNNGPGPTEPTLPDTGMPGPVAALLVLAGLGALAGGSVLMIRSR